MKRGKRSRWRLSGAGLMLGLLLLAGGGGAHTGKLAKLVPAAKTTDLLLGRLRMKLPAGARLDSRRQSIMAAQESQEHETRAVIDAGTERLVIMVYELMALAGKDFQRRAEKHLKASAAGASVSLFPVRGNDLTVVAMTPAAQDLSRPAIPVLLAVVGHADGSAISLHFYVNPEGATDLPGVARLARSILATLAAGPRRLALTGGPRRVKMLGRTLWLQVPAGYSVTSQRGPDFVVHYLSEVVALGDSGGSLGIYFGGHPSYQYRQRESRSMGKWKAAVKTTTGKLLGKDAKWHNWSHEGRRTAEAIVTLPGGRDDQVHLFIGGPTADRVKDLIRAAASFRITAP